MEEFIEKGIDEADDARGKEHTRKVEAALFIAGRFLSVKELVNLTDLNPILLRRVLVDIQDKYRESGLEIVNKEDLWKMDVSQEYVHIVNKLATGSSEFSRAEQETLAVIAYKQPVKQSVLIKIRGNKAYDHIRNFASMGLITKKRSGRTWELNLSDSFHDYFHSNKEKDLIGKEGE